MEDVSFQEESSYSTNSYASATKKPALVGLVMKLGLAKTDTQAQTVLLVIAGLAVVLAIGVYFVARPKTLPPQTPENPTWPKPLPQPYRP